MEVRISFKEKNDENVSQQASDQKVDYQVSKDKQLMRIYNWSESQLQQVKEAFDEFDIMGLNTIAAHNFGDAIRATGQTPSEAEVQNMLQQATLDDTGSMSFSEFARLLGDRGLTGDDEIREQLEDALRYFDRSERGLIDAVELKNVLKKYGEPLDEDDVNELMKLADVKGDGKIEYEEFVKKLLTR